MINGRHGLDVGVEIDIDVDIDRKGSSNETVIQVTPLSRLGSQTMKLDLLSVGVKFTFLFDDAHA